MIKACAHAKHAPAFVVFDAAVHHGMYELIRPHEPLNADSRRLAVNEVSLYRVGVTE